MGTSSMGGRGLARLRPSRLTPPLRQHICRYLQAEADRKERPDFREGWRGAFKMVRGGVFWGWGLGGGGTNLPPPIGGGWGFWKGAGLLEGPGF